MLPLQELGVQRWLLKLPGLKVATNAVDTWEEDAVMWRDPAVEIDTLISL